MVNIKKVGGMAAIIEAATYVIGMVLGFSMLAPAMEGAPAQTLPFLVDNLLLMQVWYLIIYLINGVFLVVLVLALHNWLSDRLPELAQVTTAIGLIWSGLVIASGMLLIHNASVVMGLYGSDPAQATTVWVAVSTIADGLGGAIELPGGLWILLVSWAALRVGGLPKALNYLGVVIGAVGILTLVPPLGDLAAVFGLTSIVWFAWLGVVILRRGVGAVLEAPGD